MYTITDADFDALVSGSQRRAIDPRDVAIVLFVESAGFNPASAGPGGKGGANGLNQMTPENLAAFGFTPDQWRSLSAAKQLPIAFTFWDSLVKTFAEGHWPRDAGELGALNFLPGRYKDARVWEDAGSILTKLPEKFYTDNATTYDPAKTGAITAETMQAAYDWAEKDPRNQPRLAVIRDGILAAEERAGGVEPIPANPPAAPDSPGDGPAEPPVASVADASPGRSTAIVAGVGVVALVAAIIKACR